jgi:hypothetical protein
MAEDKKPRKPGTGAAWVNKDKTENWHPEWTGEFADLDGNLYYLNIKEEVGQHLGTPYRKVSIKPKVAKAAPANAVQPTFDDLPDDISF